MGVNATQDILVPLPSGCREGIFIRRHKRFSIEFDLEGERLWAHTNNTGAMLGLLKPGRKLLVSPAMNKNRKLAWTVERVRVDVATGKSIWVGVNTSLPTLIFKRAFHTGKLDFALSWSSFKSEAIIGDSRLDACLSGKSGERMWVECKNVSLVENGIAAFPDAESMRARKHLLELMDRKKAGDDAAMFYFVQRTDCFAFAPADYIDEEYARLFYLAMEMGVQIHVFCALFEETGTGLGNRLPVLSKEVYCGGYLRGELP